MKKYLFFIMIGWASSVFGAPVNAPKLIDVGASDVFIPLGFDDNDNVQVVIEGYFPNTCYKLAPAEVQKEKDRLRIIPRAYFYHGPCLQVMVHYENVANIGLLEAGEYKVEIGAAPLDSRLLITKSMNKGPDDFLYAPIKSARLISHEPAVLRLTGVFMNSCMRMDKIVVHPESNQVVPVLPIAKYKNSGPCAQALKPFEEDVKISEKVQGRTLFHIRSLNGASINLIEEL